MKLAPDTIRGQIFSGFLVLVVLFIINLWLSYRFLEKQERIDIKKGEIERIRSGILKLYNGQLFFVENNFLDSNLYKGTGG